MSVTATSHRRRRTTLGVVLAATASAFVLTLVLDLRAGDGRGAPDALLPGPGWPTALPGLVITGLAAVVLDSGRGRRIGLVLAGFGVFVVLDGLAEAYAAFGTRGPQALPLVTVALWFFERLGSLIPVGVPLVLLLYPTGRFLPGRWGRAGKVGLAVMLAAPVIFLVRPAPALPAGTRLPAGVDRDPTTVPVDPVIFGGVSAVVFELAFLAGALAVVSVLWRYRQARGEDRVQLRWLFWAAVVVALIAVGVNLVDSPAVELVLGAFLIVVPAAAVTVGLVRPTVVPVEELLSRTVVYGLLALLVLVVDLLALAALTALVGNALDQRTVVVVVLVLTSLVYLPLRGRLLGVVRGLVLGQRTDPYAVVSGLASSLERADDPSAQLEEIASAVARAFRVAFVSVEVDRSRGERLVATHGVRPAETRTLPVSYRGAEVGRLVLPVRGLRAQLPARDEALLGHLVRQAAVAARTARLADELQESRERLILAREEERRRIRRDLHDGLGPALSGVVFGLESARLRVRPDPAAAEQDLVVARDHVRDVITDVRRLVHDLRPPALDDLGLVGALRQQAAQLSGPQLEVSVHTAATGPFPAGVEVAAYRIVGEAMTNVVRHARASVCRVELRADEQQLVVEVSDDGTGVDPQAVAGVGLASLRERADELGGWSEVVCPPDGGTQVRAWLPLRGAS